jgi:hypothetical protein
MRMRVALLSLGFLLVARRSEGAPARPLETKLAYSRAPGAEVCPDEAWLHDAIGARLGYAPFTDGAARTVVVKITRVGKGLQATIELLDSSGRSQGSRTVDSQSSDCTELASSIALDVSMAIDPVHATRAPESPPQPKPDPPPAPPLLSPPVLLPPPAPEERPAPPPPASREPIKMLVAAGPVVAIGTAPGVSLGAAVRIGVRWKGFSAAVEGRADLPASASAWSGARVQSSLLAASLLPCLHVSVAYGCAVGTLGRLSATATDIARSNREETLFAAAGVRGGVEWWFAANLGLQAHADVLAPLTPTTLLIGGRDAWTTSPVALGGGISLAAHFP